MRCETFGDQQSPDAIPLPTVHEYDGIEYAGLPVDPAVFAIRVCHSVFRG